MKKLKHLSTTIIIFIFLIKIFLSTVSANVLNMFAENILIEEEPVIYDDFKQNEIVDKADELDIIINEEQIKEDIETEVEIEDEFENTPKAEDTIILNNRREKLLSILSERVKTIETKAILNVDTNLNNATFKSSIIHIEGWKLANIENTELEIFIDNNQIDTRYIKYSSKYALTEIVTGYGTKEQNPNPHFDIDIPTINYTQGNHIIKIQFIDSNKNILDEIERIIYIDKNIKSVLNIDTKLSNQTFDSEGIKIEGWKLANTENTILEVFIDEVHIDKENIKYSYKYALTEIVKGYGTKEQNPNPHFNIDIPIDDFEKGSHRLNLQLVSQDGSILQNVQFDIKIDKTIKSVLNIDTKLSNQTFDKYGINIEGWKLANIPDTKLKVSIDNVVIDESNIKYSYKYALTEIVKGYGTKEQNPNPHFDIKVPVTNISSGSHILMIQLLSKEGVILQKYQFNIKVDKTIKSILNIDTNLNNNTFGAQLLHIEGWKLATEPDTKINVYLNDKKVDENFIKYSCKYALTEIVKGYGMKEDNPKPHFDVDINTRNYEDGKYTLKIEFITSSGNILRSKTYIIYIKKQYSGIDVSHFNSSINWKLVKDSGVEFAMIRLGYRGYRNPILVQDNNAISNIKLAQAVGIKVGVYFVTQAITVQEAQEEALWVIDTLDKNGINLDYPVAIDTELSTANIKTGDLPGRADLLDVDTRTQVCKAFCDVIKYNKRTPMIYANTYWFESNLDLSKLTSYDIWLANYTEPKLNGEYTIWQYTDKGNIAGILGNVDLNICYKKY